MCYVDDGYIRGELKGPQRTCERCGEVTMCIKIEGVELPPNVTVKATILQDRNETEPSVIRYLGVGCGDYARFQRQLVHIRGH